MKFYSGLWIAAHGCKEFIPLRVCHAFECGRDLQLAFGLTEYIKVMVRYLLDYVR